MPSLQSVVADVLCRVCSGTGCLAPGAFSFPSSPKAGGETVDVPGEDVPGCWTACWPSLASSLLIKSVKCSEPQNQGAGWAGEEQDSSLCSQVEYLQIQTTSCLKQQMFNAWKAINSQLCGGQKWAFNQNLARNSCCCVTAVVLWQLWTGHVQGNW